MKPHTVPTLAALCIFICSFTFSTAVDARGSDHESVARTSVPECCEPAPTERVPADSAPADSASTESASAESASAEPRLEPAHVEPPSAEPAHAVPTYTETARTEPADAAYTETARTEPADAVSTYTERARTEPASFEPAPLEKAGGFRGTPIRQDAARLLDEVLRASGVDDPAARSVYALKFRKRLADLERRVGRAARSSYRKARRLHDALHDTVLRQYTPTADGIDAILDRGDYNCVSATLFYGIAARAFGLDLKVVETPRHIFLQLDADGKEVDIESTSPTGFDFNGDLERYRRLITAFRYATGEDPERRGPYERFDRGGQILLDPVSLERATGFLWHNTAERALARGDAVKAASSFLEEYRSNPELARRIDGFATSLARAFRIEYEEGRFDNAYRIAEMEAMIFPHKTTTRDRILAAASKRVDAECDAGNAAGGESILDATVAKLIDPSDVAKLERELCPHIAAAAVRAADWPRALRMASRYAKSEPDRVEAERFLSWVESREAGEMTLRFEPLCSSPPHQRFCTGSFESCGGRP